MALTFSWGILGAAATLDAFGGRAHGDRRNGDDGEGDELSGLDERHGRSLSWPGCRFLARSLPRASVSAGADVPRPRVRLQPLSAASRTDAVPALALGA